MRSFSPFLALALVSGFAGCGSDHGISGLCGVPESGFDITDVSTLEDAQGYSGMHDAVILNFEGASELPAGASWRVRSVEIMPMTDPLFGDFTPDGSWVTVEIWDADNPLASEPYRVQQQFFKGDHEWTDVNLTNPSSGFPGTYQQTWWRFGFEDIIPITGMRSADYMVGVSWDSSATPTLGYSNFNRPCSLNWTDYDDGAGFVLNTGTAAGNECSWPMLRVNLEVIQESGSCEGESYTIE